MCKLNLMVQNLKISSSMTLAWLHLEPNFTNYSYLWWGTRRLACRLHVSDSILMGRKTWRFFCFWSISQLYRLVQKKIPLFESPALAAAWQTDQPMHSQSANFGKFKLTSLNLAVFFLNRQPCSCTYQKISGCPALRWRGVTQLGQYHYAQTLTSKAVYNIDVVACSLDRLCAIAL